jgi:hypothetical protein
MNSLDYVLFNGIGGIPYATFGMVGLVVGVFTYTTFVDFMKDSETEVPQVQPEVQVAEAVSSNPLSAATEKVSSLLGFESEKPSSPNAEEPGEQYKLLGGRRSKKLSRRSPKSKSRKTRRQRK